MSQAAKLSITIKQLDKLDLCETYTKIIRSQLLKNTVSSESEPFTFRDALASDAFKLPKRYEHYGETLSIRDILTPLARLAQSDPELRKRLSWFINDCAIVALPYFEKEWPEDDRPRRSIIATQEFLAGRIGRDQWVKTYREGLKAWAGWLAPTPLKASAEWAAMDYRSWSLPRELEEEAGWRDPERWEQWRDWQYWACWAAFNILIFLGKDFHSRDKKSEYLYEDEFSKEADSWATERLSLWLEPELPAPLPLEDPPPSKGVASGLPKRCTADFVDKFELEWPHMVVFPEGLRRIGGIWLERNAVLEVPEGVESIDYIRLNEHPEIHLPSTLRRIGALRAWRAEDIVIPDGVREIDLVSIDMESILHLPESILFIGKFITGAAYAACDGLMWDIVHDKLDVIGEHNNDLTDDEYKKYYRMLHEKQEKERDKNGVCSSFAIIKDQLLIWPRKNIRFDGRGRVKSAKAWDIYEDADLP